MENLIKYLTEHKKEEFNSLADKSISDLTGLTGINSIKDILTQYDIYTTGQVIHFNTDILWLIDYENEYNKYKWYTQYLTFGSVILLLILPIIASNYWLYFGLLLLPVGLMATSIIKTPFYNLFWILIAVLIAYAFYSSQYSILGVAVLNIAFMLGFRQGKLFYRDTIIRAAIRSELCFKFLYQIGMVHLYDRDNDTFVKQSNQ
jgi:hypothetical protein